MNLRGIFVKRNLSVYSCLATALLVAVGMTPAFAQQGINPGWSTYGRISLPTDWSTHHVLYTGNFKGSSPEAAMAKSHYDPRLFNAWVLRGHLPSAKPGGIAGPTQKSSEQFGRSGSPKRDWSLSLGSGGVAQNMSPAKFSFDINAAPDCTNDYVVFGLNVAGTSGQANLVGVNNLYSGTSPTGLCGTAPNVYWAYNTTTLTGGTVTTSPTISIDGTEIAFIESNGTESVLHVLKWSPNDGTVTAPSTALTLATDIATCTAPCMTSLTYDSAHGTTLSSPYYDYQPDDALYVGNNNGQLFRIVGVFSGTPTVDTTNGWSATGNTVAAAGIKMTAPIWDSNSGNIFIGGSDGYLYAVSSSAPGTQEKIQVGSGSADGGGIVDSPTIDVSNGTVYAYAASNAAGMGNATANRTAVTVQASITSLGSPQVATIGRGTRGTTAGLNTVSGDFDNTYYNWSGTGANTGYFYMIGTAAGAASPTLYQIPFSGIGSVNVTGNGSHYTTPVITITDATGSNATLQASGGVDSVTLTNDGSGYASMPVADFTDAPAGGTTASGSAVTVAMTGLTISDNGSGYTSVPTVTIGGTGSGGSASVALGIASVTVNTGGAGYTSVPTVTAPGGTTNASLTSRVGTSSVTVTSGGTYTTTTGIPTVTFTGGGAGTAQVGVTNIALTADGSGYTAVPTVTISGTNTGAASATAALGVGTIAVTASGSGYTAVPTVSIPGGTTNATAIANLGVVSLALTGGGSGYTSVPTVTISGADGATATATLGVLSASFTGGGTCTTGTQTVTFTGGGGGTGATATATVAGGTVTGITITAAGSGYKTVPSYTVANCTAQPTGKSVKLSVVGLTLTADGSGYTSVPTVSFSASGSTTAATATASLGVETVTVNTAGTGYTSVPTVSFSGTPTTSATATASLKVVSVSVTAAGSYTTFPTATITGNATLGAVTATVVGVSVTTAGSSATYPTVTFSRGSGGATAAATVTGATVTGVVIGTNGNGIGYTSVPTVTFSTSGSTTAATATASLGVYGATVTAAGSYTTFPTATVSGGSGAALSAIVEVVGVGLPTTPGSGYTTAPTVTLCNGTYIDGDCFGGTGSGGTGTSTIDVTAVAVTYGGGGYTAPTVTISDSDGGSGTGATATVSVNPGSQMTAGTSPITYAITGTTQQTSPITENYNPTTLVDMLFYSTGLTGTTSEVVGQAITGGTISGSPSTYSVSSAGPGTSAIVVDNISSEAQASSIYFGTLGSTPAAVKLTQSGLD